MARPPTISGAAHRPRPRQEYRHSLQHLEVSDRPQAPWQSQAPAIAPQTGLTRAIPNTPAKRGLFAFRCPVEEPQIVKVLPNEPLHHLGMDLMWPCGVGVH